MDKKRYIVFSRALGTFLTVASAVSVDAYGTLDLSLDVRHFIRAPGENVKQFLGGLGKFIGGMAIGFAAGRGKGDRAILRGTVDMFRSTRPNLPSHLPAEVPLIMQAVELSLGEAIDGLG